MSAPRTAREWADERYPDTYPADQDLPAEILEEYEVWKEEQEGIGR